MTKYRNQSEKRVMEAINWRRPDRIPRMDSYWEEFVVGCRSKLQLSPEIDLKNYFGIDITIAYPQEAPFFKSAGLIEVKGEYEIHRNVWGHLVQVRPHTYFEEELKSDVLTEKRFLDGLQFDAPDAPERYEKFMALIKNNRSKRCVFGKIGGPFIRSLFVRGKKQFLMDIAEDPEFAKALIDKMGLHLLEIGKQELQKGNLYDTGIWIYDDMAFNQGPLFSPKAFERLLLPIYKHMVSELKKYGANKVCFHSDGNIEPLLDMLVEAGIDAINPLEPRAGMDMEKLIHKYGTKLAYIGGMCNSLVLPNGPRERIRSDVSKIINLGRNGGVIIGAHSIGPDVPVEHYQAYIEAINELGGYQ